MQPAAGAFTIRPMKIHSPACERNRDPILAVLRDVFPTTGTALEISAGSGMHSAWFAPRLPGLTWFPSDLSDEALASIAAWTAEVEAPNLQPPLRLDTRDPAWDLPTPHVDAMLCCNMVHISPWASAVGLFAGAGRHLAADGVLVTYGPYRFADRPFAPSNARFDASLRSRDPSWGVRDVADLDAAAATAGLARTTDVALPANNHCLIWRRR